MKRYLASLIIMEIPLKPQFKNILKSPSSGIHWWECQSAQSFSLRTNGKCTYPMT